MEVRLFFMLLGGHYLADYGLQTEFMATTKSRASKDAVGFHSLTAHAAIQGLTAGLLAQRLSIGLVVGVSHWIIDYGKAVKNLYGINADQALHILVILFAVLFLAK